MAKKQMTLFDWTVQTREIKKHSSLVQMGNITTLRERKSLNALIYIAKDALKRTPEQRVFTCDLSTIKRLTWWDNSNINNLKQALRNLQETSIEYNILGKDNTEERGVFSVLAEAKIRSMGKGKSSQVRFEFPSTVLSAIKNPRIYVKLNLLMLRGFSSKHSLALYEFLADYLNLKSYRCRTEDFRSLMGIEAGQYAYFTMLRKRVLDVAVKEINEKSDVVVSYDVEKEGRKYTAIVFKMGRQKDTLDEYNAEYEIREKLKSFGLNNDVIETLLENHDESYLWVNIAVVEEQYAKGKVKNVAGYLLQAFANDYSQQKQAVKAEKKALINSNLTNGEDELKKQFEKERRGEVSDYLTRLSDEELKRMEVDFATNKNNDVRYKSLSKTKDFSDPMIQSIFYRYVASEHLPEKWHSFESFRAVSNPNEQEAINGR